MSTHHGDTEAQSVSGLLSEALTDLNVREAQSLTHLKLTGKHLGLIILLNVAVLHRAIMRRVL